MINPIAQAYNLFVNVFLAFPNPIQYLVGLAFGLMVITIVVSMVFRG